MRAFLRAWLIGCFLASVGGAQPLGFGRGQASVPYQGSPLTVYTYKPRDYKQGPLIIVFHGIVRNADEYRNSAITLGDRFGALIVAPVLDDNRFPDEWYQRGGIVDAQDRATPPDKWMFNVVPAIVSEIRQREQNPALPYYLIGQSAGAQFLVRLAAYQPGEAKRIVSGNAGSLLFPSREHAFGYGLGGLPAELSDDSVLQRYFAAPLTLYLGTNDVTPKKRFDASEAGMKQGPHRLGRNRNAFELARKMAAERGWVFNWRKVETPGIEHDAAKMFAAREVEDALFGEK